LVGYSDKKPQLGATPDSRGFFVKTCCVYRLPSAVLITFAKL
jgi:hypothetical protein